MISDLKRVIDQVSRDKGIDRAILISTLEEAIKSAAKKRFGLSENFEVAYNEETGDMEVFRFKEVVTEVEDPQLQISLQEAKALDPESQIGDELGVKMDTSGFGRIAAQSAKQVIIQRMKDAERDIVFEDFKDRVGEIVNGLVQRFDKGSIVINLGRTEAILPINEQMPKENYRRGDRVRALVIDVKQISRGPQVVLSRTHPDFMTALFATEVPEIAEGIVKIVAAAREPGSRSKIAVKSEDSDIDPVGACVGMRGSRVQSVVQELRGEKIDIIPYNPDPARFIVSALAPAVVSRVIMDEASKTMEVVVSDEQLSLAIGRKGQNVRLASRLSGWRIDVKNETKYQRSLKEGYQSLIRLPGVGEVTADALYEAGYGSAADILAAGLENLMEIEGIDLTKAEKIQAAAKEYLNNLDKEPESTVMGTSQTTRSTKKSAGSPLRTAKTNKKSTKSKESTELEAADPPKPVVFDSKEDLSDQGD
ncbi:MAG: transcription termination/antitermination protein NusA [Deltaproteobacteria bacterium]|nr:transcription termination/antitermination protein NusA [Deltaproteobacteria bacterium]